jgi:hypothetical protein
MKAGTATDGDLNLGALATSAIDLDQHVLFTVADNCDPVRFSAAALDLNDGLFAVANYSGRGGFSPISLDLHQGFLGRSPVNLDARFAFS